MARLAFSSPVAWTSNFGSPNSSRPTMSLVQYPDSESEDDASEPLGGQLSDQTSRPTAKRKRSDSELPPLPAAFHDLYASNARIGTSDDPSLHGGRKRAVPHVEGNWPSHVYLEWVPSQTEFKSLHSLVEHVRTSVVSANKSRQKPLPVPGITPSLQSPLGAPLSLHISLSRTLQIKTNNRDDFLKGLTSSIQSAAVRPFNIRFSTLKWVPNFERNRWFLVLGIEKPVKDELNKLLAACNEAAEKCGHPGLYTGGKGDGPMEGSNPRGHAKKRESVPGKGSKLGAGRELMDRTENFHVSIAWNLVEPEPEWAALVRDVDATKYLESPEAPFDVVKAKIGNVVNNIELSSRQSGLGKGGGLLGLG